MGCATSSGAAGVVDSSTEVVVQSGVHAEQRTGGRSQLELARSAKKNFHREFILKSHIGNGSFAQVHLAEEIASGEDRAVKVLDLRQPIDIDGSREEGRSEKKVRQAKREVNVLKHLGQHANVVQYYTSFADEALTYIIMEYSQSTLLEALTRMRDITESIYVGLFRQVFEGLRHIHARDIVHRDIKPDNFLISKGEDGLCLKICDFGLAEVMTKTTDLVSSSYGTAPYMSPEMLNRQGYNTGTDVWSAGVSAYALLFGAFPYRSSSNSSEGMKSAIAAGAVEPSFRPSPSINTQGKRWLSLQGEAFLRNTLVRSKAERPTAVQALKSKWLLGSMSQGAETSLKAALTFAQQAGAFDFRTRNATKERKSTEKYLQVCQAREHPERIKDAYSKESKGHGQGAAFATRPPAEEGRRSVELARRSHSKPKASGTSDETSSENTADISDLAQVQYSSVSISCSASTTSMLRCSGFSRSEATLGQRGAI